MKKVKLFPRFEITTVHANACTTDTAPYVLSILDKTFDDEQKAHAMMESVNIKRYDVLSRTTQAIVKAAQNDDRIDLSTAFSGDMRKMGVLNDQLGLALGFRETVIVNNASRIATARQVLRYFPAKNEDRATDSYRRKATLRSNFLHMLKKCAQAAATIIEQKINVEDDKKSGTLLLSGPAIKARFGEESVLLNEKQMITHGNTNIILKERPSFSAIAAMSAKEHGVRTKRTVTASISDPDLALASLCASFIAAMNRLKGKLTDKQRVNLFQVQSAIEKTLA